MSLSLFTLTLLSLTLAQLPEKMVIDTSGFQSIAMADVPEEAVQQGLMGLVWRANLDLRNLADTRNARIKHSDSRTEYIFDCDFRHGDQFHVFRVLVAKEGLVYQYQHAQEVDSSHRPTLMTLLSSSREGNPIQRMVSNLLDRIGQPTQMDPAQVPAQVLLLAKTQMEDLVPSVTNMTMSVNKASSEVVVGRVMNLDMVYSDNNTTVRSQASVYRRMDGQLQMLSLKQIE